MPALRFALALTGLLALSACASNPLGMQASFADSKASLDDTSAIAYFPTDDLIAAGRAQFHDGNYGNSYKLFKKSVEVFPQDASAWLGLAASADKVGRFDTSDIAYRRLGTMIPGRLEYYNNVGYSYLLRGEMQRAEEYFLRAYAIDPANPAVVNNLQLLRGSVGLANTG